MEFLYCDKFVQQVTNQDVRKVSEICKLLSLTHTYNMLKKKADYAKLKMQQGLMKEI